TLMLALGVATSVQAADLKQLLEAADSQNVDKRISMEQRRRAAAEAVQAWTTLLPTLTVQGGWTHNQYGAFFDRPRQDKMGNYLNADNMVVLDPRQAAIDTFVITPYQQYDAVFRVDVPMI